MHRVNVRGELAEVVAGQKPGRLSRDEVIVFDSTGTALQDVAAAALAYRRALALGVGVSLDLGGTAESSERHEPIATARDRAGESRAR